jgi:Methane oxygenase PmoA
MRIPAFVLSLTLGTALHSADIPVSIDLGMTPAPDGAVTLPLLPPGEWALKASDGTQVPIARGGDGIGRALLPGLTGAQTFTLEATAATPALIAVEQQAEENQRLSVAGKEIATWQGGRGALEAGYDEKLRRGGYLARLLTPTGRLVTGNMPAKHKHHHGVWFSWTKTEFDGRHPDFWNMGEGKGGVQNESTSPIWSAGAWAGFTAINRYDDLTSGKPVAVLGERLSVVIRAPLPNDPVLVIDLTVVQHCLTPQPLFLPTYHYGGLGLRGREEWDGAANTRFLSSEGKTRANGNATRGRWCWMGGQVDGALAGTVILGHPGNVRAPQPLRMHPSEPFLCFAPSQLGDWRIAPDEPVVQRYRIIVADGEPDAAAIDRRWTAYANEPIVTIDPKPLK